MNDADQVPPMTAAVNANQAELVPEENGADLLDEVYATLTRFVAFADEHQPVAVALWTATTHALPAWHHATKLCITSPMKRCGKTRLMEVSAALSFNSVLVANTSVAALFRLVSDSNEHDRPTIFHDEVDAVFGTRKAAEQNDDLRGLYNSSYQRDWPVWRCVGVGTNQESVPFDVFSMSMLAAIKHIPDTISDRAVNIALRRRAPGETVARYRSRRDGPALEELRNKIKAWVRSPVKDDEGTTRLDRLRAAEPTMPDAVEDRAQDAWEPLFTIAEEAGGDWPQRVRDACAALTGAAAEDDEECKLDTKLLSDIRDIVDEHKSSFIASAALAQLLRARAESPWQKFELNENGLAQRLRPFGVKPGRDTSGKVRGYRVDELTDAFRRYLRQNPPDRQTMPSDKGKVEDDGKTATRQNPSEPVKSDTRLTRSDYRENTAQCGVLAGHTITSDGLTASDTDPKGGGLRDKGVDTSGKRPCPECRRTGLPSALGGPCLRCQLKANQAQRPQTGTTPPSGAHG
ncbi:MULTISPECIES: DUF3631 domain-containing protein [unclassified Mycobacterium]|uniref:DUF3631 domain-containing protein n=1 Tax=unclassified Mycobacterium TaxID=2642494 RepID=UPI0007417627|nr:MULTISPECIES: DUF3631 domain-containing protein [unclassified Mycobacterium]KUH86478.1 hypothetical protein AU187_06925 [Mycobacterium sp. IS-1556]